MRRLLALVAAATMIGGALLLRSALDDDGDDSGASSDGRVRVVCTPDLQRACETWDAVDDDVEVRVEDAATTAAALQSGESAADAWLAPAAWVNLVAAVEPSPVGKPSPALARTRVAIAVRADLNAALQTACGGTVGWRCLGELAESTGVAGIPGRVEVALPDVESGSGLGVLGAAGAGWFARADFSANDFTDPAFDGWLAGLAANAADVAGSGRPPIDRLVTELGRFTAVAALGLDADRVGPGGSIAVTYPAPVTTVDVVLAPIGGRLDDDEIAELAEEAELTKLLLEHGWKAPTDPSLPDGSNQPRGGVLAALLDRWREAR